MPPIGGGGGDFGDDLGDLGAPGGEDMGDLGGTEGSADLGDMGEDTGAPMESVRKLNGKKLINERLRGLISEYTNKVLNVDDTPYYYPETTSDNFFINEEMNKSIKELDKISENKTQLDNLLD